MTMPFINTAARTMRVAPIEAASSRFYPRHATEFNRGSVPTSGSLQTCCPRHDPLYSRMLKVLTAVAIAFALAAIPAWTHASSVVAKKDGATRPGRNGVRQLTAEEMTFVENTIFRATNILRKRKGLRPLTSSRALGYLARHHSRDMCHTGAFKHESDAFPKGWKRFKDRMKLAGLRDGGENIAFQTLFKDRRKWAISIVKGWMGSPPHRKNILDPAFRYLGVGIGQCGKDIGYVTQVFSTRPGDTPVLRHRLPRHGGRAHLDGYSERHGKWACHRTCFRNDAFDN